MNNEFYGTELRLVRSGPQHRYLPLRQQVKTAEDWRLFQYLRRRAFMVSEARTQFLVMRSALRVATQANEIAQRRKWLS